MDHEDEERSKLETARNQLESYIYKCKELTWEDDIEEFTKETELEQLKELASELGEWLDDHMDTGKTSEFIEQKEKLVVVAGPIFTRRSEFSQRPVQVENLEIGLTTTEKAIEHLNSILNETVLTQEELDTFTKDVKEVRDWYTETSEKQSKLLKSDNPVLIVKDLKEKQKSLRKLAKRIDPAKLMKPKPKEPKSSKDFTDQELENLKKSGLSKEDIDKILKELKQKEDKAKAESESDKAASDKAASDKTASDKAEPTTEEPQEHTEL
jgi:hypothetical protein